MNIWKFQFILCFSLLTVAIKNKVAVVDDYCDPGAGVQAKFALPKTANTLVGDSTYVYVTFEGDLNHLYGYKLGSDGLPLGADYSVSTNVSLSLPSARAETFTTSVIYRNYLFLGASPNLIYVIDKASMRVETVINILVLPQFLAIDKLGYVYVSSGGELVYVFNFVGGVQQKVTTFDLSNGTQAAGCGIYVSGDDHLYFSFASKFINVYSIGRDILNRPIKLSKSSFVNENGCVFVLTLDKYDSIVALDGNVLDVSSTDGFENVYCLPVDVNTLQMWSDPVSGFAFFITTNSYLYAVSYPAPELRRI